MRLLRLSLGEKYVEEVVTEHKPEWKIRDVWKKRYGQLFKKCVVTLITNEVDAEDLNDRPVINLKTDEVYQNREEAEKLTGFHRNTVYRQLYRKNSPKFNYTLKFL